MPKPGPNPGFRGRILVADDEPHIRRILVTILESGGYQVDQASGGPQAVQLLSGDTPYAMALLDLMMPGFTGLQVMEKVLPLPHRKDLVVVVLTAKGQDADRAEAFRLGAREFVTKPFSPKKLLARINHILDAT